MTVYLSQEGAVALNVALHSHESYCFILGFYGNENSVFTARFGNVILGVDVVLPRNGAGLALRSGSCYVT